MLAGVYVFNVLLKRKSLLPVELLATSGLSWIPCGSNSTGEMAKFPTSTLYFLALSYPACLSTRNLFMETHISCCVVVLHQATPHSRCSMHFVLLLTSRARE